MNLKKFYDSHLHKKIILFFIENPASVDSPRGIATWVGHSREEAKAALDELVEAGILDSIEAPSTAGYSFTKDEKRIRQIKDFFKQQR
jgi:hypothetical protein